MTALTALYWLLTALAGGLVAGALRPPLRVEERVALAVVTGVLGSALCALGLATIAGMRGATVLAGPALLAVIGLLASVITGGGPLESWRDSLHEVPARWHSRELIVVGGVSVAAVIGFAVLFSHTLFAQDGNIVSNFATVWADWSMHATTASNFAVGNNLPPTNPIFSGTPLMYPFLPDFQSGMLLTLGSGIGASLAVPSALMCVAIVLLVMSVARRLTGSVTAGVVAVGICMLGGSLGAEGVYWDACKAGGATATQCAPSRFVSDPIGAVQTVVHTVGSVPGVIASQTRPYDALQPTDSHPAPLSNIQWNTPMLAWWLPQRPFLFGFAAVLAVFLLVLAVRGEPGRRWSAFVVAGLLAGVLPLVHVHSFIALLLVLPVFALIWRRREWLAFAAVALALATPRLVQLATSGDHGADALGNTFPWLEPGWLSQSISGAAQQHRTVNAESVLWGIGGGLRSLITPQWWGFWLVNCGIVMPVMVIVGLAAAGRALPERLHLRGVSQRVAGMVSSDLLRFCLPFLVIFALANVVVFQSWDWDNTKLFAYWYFGGALLIGGIVVHLWRSGWWRATLGTLALLSVIMTGTVVMLRYLPWTPSQQDIFPQPITWAGADDLALAAQVESRTPAGSVVLTDGRHTDPLLTIAGRRTVLGYTGWLWSYGIDYRTRQQDVAIMFEGCPGTVQSCDATTLMKAYHVSYVEINANDYVRLFPNGSLQWWASTFPEVARVGAVAVYDVRTQR
ncbi:MAG TPA: hypothetical protein VGQ42_13280 [Candidatus Dormibacteraeota bacterium]|nr:hypothetical protein [Candidatus Dormibacteraeota bacterium]